MNISSKYIHIRPSSISRPFHHRTLRFQLFRPFSRAFISRNRRRQVTTSFHVFRRPLHKTRTFIRFRAHVNTSVSHLSHFKFFLFLPSPLYEFKDFSNRYPFKSTYRPFNEMGHLQIVQNRSASQRIFSTNIRLYLRRFLMIFPNRFMSTYIVLFRSIMNSNYYLRRQISPHLHLGIYRMDRGFRAILLNNRRANRHHFINFCRNPCTFRFLFPRLISISNTNIIMYNCTIHRPTFVVIYHSNRMIRLPLRVLHLLNFSFASRPSCFLCRINMLSTPCPSSRFLR